MHCAAAVERVRALIAGAMPPELHDASIDIGHPGAPEEYAFVLSLYVLQVRENVQARDLPGHARSTVIEAPLLVAAHAPPERGFDGVRLLEVATEVIRANPHLGALAPHSTAQVMLQDTPIAEMSRLWQAPGAPLQSSVLCRLRVVVDHEPAAPVARA